MKKINKYIVKATRYIFINRWRLVFLIPLFLFINMVSNLPYFSLLLTFENKMVLFWILIVLVLRMGYKGTSLIALALTLLAVISAVRGRDFFAEQLGIIIVALIFLAFLQSNLNKDS